MSTTEQRFQSFITRVRPHRVAVLTNISDPHWQDACIGIIEYFTKLWGGTHCIIIPTDGKTIDETFWAVLSSHDPDTIYRYQRTGEDERICDPENFAKIVAEHVTDYAKQADMEEDQVRDSVKKELLESSFDEWHVSESLREELLMRIAPFHFEKQPHHGMPDRQLNVPSITRGDRPNHPLTAVADVLKASKRPKDVVQIVRDVDDTVAPSPLWLAATIGKGDDAYFTEMNQIEVVPMPVPMSHHRQSEIIKWGISPRANLEMPYPFGITASILTPVMAVRSRRFQLPTVVVVGDTLQDFCLYHALYWQHGRALWLPSWFMTEDDHWPRFMTAIREAESNGRMEHNERLSFVSYSVGKAVLEELKQRTLKYMYRTQITIDDIVPQTVAWWLQYPSRLYAEGNLGDVTTHLLFNKNLPGTFESPLPRKLNPASPLDHRWIVDITFLENLVPRHPGLGHRIVTGPNMADVRTGREELSYMCPGALVMGNYMDTNMLRPNIHVPDADEVFRIVLEDCDYRVKTSDKGRYEATTVQKFGGLDMAGDALRSEKQRTLLMKFLDKSSSVVDEGVYLKSDQRRYMDFASIRKIMQDDALSYDIIDEYSGKGVIYRGYIFQCENCSDAAWHSIADVDQTFTCRRCGLKQVYKHQHWKLPNEPLWYYKLDEMVYLMLKNNGHVPLLTLNKLRVSSKESFLFCHELRIFPKEGHKAFLEMDICCIANGKLCIGEAKNNGDLKGDLTEVQTAERYRDLALKIGATMVMFSTTENAWSNASLKAIDEAFVNHPHIEVKKWASGMLYG